jgi:hypothetical protein
MTSWKLSRLARETLFAQVGERLRPRRDVIDVIMPTTRKDWPSLPHAIVAARKKLRHRIRRFYVIGPESPKEDHSLFADDIIFLNEENVAPIEKSNIFYRPKGVNRAGWLFQQLIKLSCDEICEAEYVLALDADTILTHSQRLVKGGATVFNISEERHEPYHRIIRRLLPGMPVADFSFVSHHMLFKKEYLRELKKELARNGRQWFQRILDELEPEEMSGFSEYELYGNFVSFAHPDAVSIEHSLNQSYAARRINRLWYIKLRHPFLKAASFHNR